MNSARGAATYLTDDLIVVVVVRADGRRAAWLLVVRTWTNASDYKSMAEKDLRRPVEVGSG